MAVDAAYKVTIAWRGYITLTARWELHVDIIKLNNTLSILWSNIIGPSQVLMGVSWHVNALQGIPMPEYLASYCVSRRQGLDFLWDDRAVSMAGPRCWNGIPPSTRAVPTAESFKSRQKKYYLRKRRLYLWFSVGPVKTPLQQHASCYGAVEIVVVIHIIIVRWCRKQSFKWRSIKCACA